MPVFKFPFPLVKSGLVALVAAALIAGAAPAARAATLSLSGNLDPGTAVLLTLSDFPPGSRFSGKLGGTRFPISANGEAMIALDMEAAAEPISLDVTITPPSGSPIRLHRMLQPQAREYHAEYLTVAPSQVNLNQTDLTRSRGETAAIKATYRLRSDRVGFQDGFSLPVQGRISGVFGSRRFFNDQPRRPHGGLDIAIGEGTPIAAPASGTVALAGENYFFTGNTVVLDHGHGVVSLYAHMSAIDVEQGQWIPAGTVIGKIGMTGRVTGPHLHWGVLVRGQRVDPARLPGMPDLGLDSADGG